MPLMHEQQPITGCEFQIVGRDLISPDGTKFSGFLSMESGESAESLKKVQESLLSGSKQVLYVSPDKGSGVSHINIYQRDPHSKDKIVLRSIEFKGSMPELKEAVREISGLNHVTKNLGGEEVFDVIASDNKISINEAGKCIIELYKCKQGELSPEIEKYLQRLDRSLKNHNHKSNEKPLRYQEERRKHYENLSSDMARVTLPQQRGHAKPHLRDTQHHEIKAAPQTALTPMRHVPVSNSAFNPSPNSASQKITRGTLSYEAKKRGEEKIATERAVNEKRNTQREQLMITPSTTANRGAAANKRPSLREFAANEYLLRRAANAEAIEAKPLISKPTEKAARKRADLESQSHFMGSGNPRTHLKSIFEMSSNQKTNQATGKVANQATRPTVHRASLLPPLAPGPAHPVKQRVDMPPPVARGAKKMSAQKKHQQTTPVLNFIKKIGYSLQKTFKFFSKVNVAKPAPISRVKKNFSKLVKFKKNKSTKLVKSQKNKPIKLVKFKKNKPAISTDLPREKRQVFKTLPMYIVLRIRKIFQTNLLRFKKTSIKRRKILSRPKNRAARAKLLRFRRAKSGKLKLKKIKNYKFTPQSRKLKKHKTIKSDIKGKMRLKRIKAVTKNTRTSQRVILKNRQTAKRQAVRHHKFILSSKKRINDNLQLRLQKALALKKMKLKRMKLRKKRLKEQFDLLEEQFELFDRKRRRRTRKKDGSIADERVIKEF